MSVARIFFVNVYEALVEVLVRIALTLLWLVVGLYGLFAVAQFLSVFMVFIGAGTEFLLNLVVGGVLLAYVVGMARLATREKWIWAYLMAFALVSSSYVYAYYLQANKMSELANGRSDSRDRLYTK